MARVARCEKLQYKDKKNLFYIPLNRKAILMQISYRLAVTEQCGSYSNVSAGGGIRAMELNACGNFSRFAGDSADTEAWFFMEISVEGSTIG